MPATTPLPVYMRLGAGPELSIGTVTVDVDHADITLDTRAAVTTAAMLREAADRFAPLPPVDPDDLRSDLRDVITQALDTPVPCPRCERTAPCRCIGDRSAARVEAVVQAVLNLFAGN